MEEALSCVTRRSTHGDPRCLSRTARDMLGAAPVEIVLLFGVEAFPRRRVTGERVHPAVLRLLGNTEDGLAGADPVVELGGVTSVSVSGQNQSAHHRSIASRSRR